jgi:hypothetical protein
MPGTGPDRFDWRGTGLPCPFLDTGARRTKTWAGDDGRGQRTRQSTAGQESHTHADLNASGATRIAGSFNFKDAYGPHFFLRVQLCEVHRVRTTSVDELAQLDLVAPDGRISAGVPCPDFQ